MARPITVTIPHSLGIEEARRRITQGFGTIEEQLKGGMLKFFSIQRQWEGDRLHLMGEGMGQKVSGRLDVLADAVRIQIDLPELLASLAGRVTEKLTTAAQRLLKA